MNRLIRKLLAAVMALVLTVVMVVAVSYAWLTLSDAPVLEGIQISIGGGDTILIAPNLSEEVDGTVYHYPGRFNGNLIFSQHEQYGYLQDVAGLSPVSTADGLHWFVAEYYDYNDEAVLNGEATVGLVKPIDEFSCDTRLFHANLSPEQSEPAQKGSYVYVDFWVVSPGADYTLRISTGEANGGGGSFLMEPPIPVEGEDGTYTLEESDGYAAASARVGFLVCQDLVVDEKNLDMYRNSAGYNPDYALLRGIYQQPGAHPLYSEGYRFTVYEPNADLHPDGENGAYYLTSPIGYEGDRAVYADMRGKVAVQLSGRWPEAGEATGLSLRQTFDMWQITHDLSDMSSEEIQKSFYGDYLQNHLLPYVGTGRFVQRADNLYGYGAEHQTDRIPAAELSAVMGSTAGATEDTYVVRLEKDVPQRIRMFVWLEGQDVDCRNPGQTLRIVLNIELAGGRE